MALETRPEFFWFTPITIENYYLDFAEGGPTLFAQLTIGAKTPREVVEATATAMNAAGGQTYTVTLDRNTRLVTISAPGNFELYPDTGSHNATTMLKELGFTTDRSGSNSYVADTQMGFTFRPQFLIQNFTPFENLEESTASVVNESAKGIIEVFKFGQRNFMRLRMLFVTDLDMGEGNIIETQASALANMRTYLQFATTKSPHDFVPNRSSPSIFTEMLLESTPRSKKGTGFEIREMTDRNLANYYDSGLLTYRRL